MIEGTPVRVHHDEVLAVLAQARELAERAEKQLATLGLVGVFIPGLRSHVAGDRLRESVNELRRMELAVAEAKR